MNFKFQPLSKKDVFWAFVACALFLLFVSAPRIQAHSWADTEVSVPAAYVCLESNSLAVREEMAQIIQSSNAHQVSCGHSYDFRIVANKNEARHGTSMTEVWVSFDVYDAYGNNVTWVPSMSSGPYHRDRNEARRIHNVGQQIQMVIRENRRTYLESINNL